MFSALVVPALAALIAFGLAWIGTGTVLLAVGYSLGALVVVFVFFFVVELALELPGDRHWEARWEVASTRPGQILIALTSKRQQRVGPFLCEARGPNGSVAEAGSLVPIRYDVYEDEWFVYPNDFDARLPVPDEPPAPPEPAKAGAYTFVWYEARLKRGRRWWREVRRTTAIYPSGAS